MTFTHFAIAMLILVAAVVVWLLYEIRVDKRDQVKPTAPGPQERWPPKSDI